MGGYVYNDPMGNNEKKTSLPEEKQNITIAHIAASAGVAISTVSKVMNERPGISPGTRKKVWAAVKKFNFTPQASARELGGRNGKTIGIFSAFIQDPYCSAMMGYVFHAVCLAGYFPLLCPVDSPEQEAFYVNELLSRRVSGVLFVSSDVFSQEEIDRLVASTEVASIQTDIPGVPVINTNDEESTYEIIRHLITLGHENIACLTPDLRYGNVKRRLEGYRRALLEAGLPYREEYVKYRDLSLSFRDISELMAFSHPPTAIHCATDEIAQKAYLYLRSAGIRIPEDMSFTTFDGLESSQLMTPAPTTVVQPLKAMAEEGVRMLVHNIEHPKDKDLAGKVLPSIIRLGGSAAPPRKNGLSLRK